MTQLICKQGKYLLGALWVADDSKLLNMDSEDLSD